MSERFQPVVTENKSRSERIVSQIKSLMLEGKLKPGDKLPPERDLAEILNVSRTSVREAIKTLSAMGLVVIKKGHGVFIGEANLESVINRVGSALVIKKDEIADLFEIRKLLETQAARWAAERAGEEEKISINYLVHEAKKATEDPATGVDVIINHDKAFHNAVIQVSHNNILAMVNSGLLEALSRVRARTVLVPGRLAQSVLDHEEIARAITAGDGRRAGEAMFRHIESVENSIMDI